jgi:hypothetical protein
MKVRWQPSTGIVLWGILTMSVIGIAPVFGADPRPAETTRVVEYAGKPVRLRLGVGSSTQVEMPEEVVDVVTALTAQQLGVDFSGTHVLAHALEHVEGEVFVITSSGASYALAVTTTDAPDRRDAIVRITALGTRAKQRTKETRTLTAVELIRAMARREVPPGVEQLKASGQEVYRDGTLALTLQEAYIAPRMRGYVLLAENLTGVSVPVPVQEMDIPGLLAIGTFEQLLYPKPRTVEERLAAAYQCLLYVVLRRDTAERGLAEPVRLGSANP